MSAGAYNRTGPIMWVAPPPNGNLLDFSTLPGREIPKGNEIYFADLDNNSFLKISKSNTQWVIVDTHI